MNNAGSQWWIKQRNPPYYSQGWTSQNMLLAANFGRGTRQVFSTTVFVELLTF
jgi:hypothetical protein